MAVKLLPPKQTLGEPAPANPHAKLVASIVALERFQLEIRQARDRDDMLSHTLSHLRALLPIRFAGFYFPSGDELEFSLQTQLDPEDARQLSRHVDRAIESGVFGWALKHLRPAAFGTSADEGMLILGALRTRQRVLGMFAAVLHSSGASGWDTNVTVLATYLACAADAILSEELTQQLQQHNRNLDALVRERTRDLESAKQAAEVANQAKSTFLATISHELRTPLNAILGYSQMLRRTPALPSPAADQVTTIHNSAEHLLALINDLLDLAKAEVNRIELLPGPVDVRLLVRETANIVRLRIEEKNLALTLSIDSEVPETLVVDAKRLRQTLLNLLSNALKFTQQGFIRLEVVTQGTKIRFSVTDSGCGIAPADLDKLCRPFQQLGDSAQRVQGSGLGLVITKKIVQAMGGELKIESVPGKGSTVWFEFAIDLPVAPKRRTPGSSEPIIEIAKGGPPQKLELDPSQAQILRRLAIRGDVLALQDILQTWIAKSPGPQPELTKLLELASAFRIKAIRKSLHL